MIQRMDEIADLALGIDRRQALVLRDRLVEVSLFPVGPGQDVLDEGNVVASQDRRPFMVRKSPGDDLSAGFDGFLEEFSAR